MWSRRKLLLLLSLCVLILLSILTSNHVINLNNRSLGEQAILPVHLHFNNELNNLNNELNNDFNTELNAELKTEWKTEKVLKKLKIPYKLFHIDLKGGPPKLYYLKSLLKNLNATGCNGILIEYEDMFPFDGKLINISHGNAYNKIELTDFLLEVKKYNFEIIPLIQTFGHLEFLLKYQQFKEFREIEVFPQEICPKNLKAINVVKEIIDQVLDFHMSLNLSLKYVHIGCDEVYHLGECDRCRKDDPKELFVSHVTLISKYVNYKYKLKSIIWDDMLRKFYQDELKKSKLGEFVELMVWDYTENVDHLVSPFLWPMYADNFKHIWAASAFKGAFGETLYQVNVKRHIDNQISWIEVLKRESPRIINFRGIAVTGWSRYDHFSVLCELLPIGIPSLYASLLTLNQVPINVDLKKLLDCQDLSPDYFPNLESCAWPGHDLFNEINQFKYYKESVIDLINNWKENKGWFTNYNYNFNETSIWRLEEPKIIAKGYLNNIYHFKNDINSVFSKYFNDFVTKEWITQKITDLTNQLELFIKNIQTLQKFNVFKRRPFL